MRYYAITPEPFPELPGNTVLTVVHFDELQYRREVDRDCFGYVEYETPLTEKQAVQYGLVREPLLDFSQRYYVDSGNSTLRTFATVKELNEWFGAQPPMVRHFCRICDLQKHIELQGCEYRHLEPKKQWRDLVNAHSSA